MSQLLSYSQQYPALHTHVKSLWNGSADVSLSLEEDDYDRKPNQIKGSYTTRVKCQVL